MKKPVCELFVRSEFPREELRGIIIRDGDDIRTGTELTPRELNHLGYGYKERHWEGNEEEIMRLFEKWTSKQSTMSAVVYKGNAMIASYENETEMILAAYRDACIALNNALDATEEE